MITPLFPENNGFISIKQRDTGDCYLLATLECFFGANTEGYALIQRLFTRVAMGVEVRFFRNEHSRNLKINKLAENYGYRYDRIRNQDVFYISDQRLYEIDQAVEGVMTNSLAVKILERLIPYYFSCPWDTNRPVSAGRLVRSDSVNAHNFPGTRINDSETSFLGKLFGVSSLINPNTRQIIQLKNIFPNQPIYLSMQYGTPDANGVVRTRHAFKIEKTQLDKHKPGQYEFILINPSNNSLHQVYSQEHIEQNNPHFVIFETDRVVFQWFSLLLRVPDLLNKLTHIKRLNPRFEPQTSIDIVSNDILALHAIIRERLISEANVYIEHKLQKVNRFSIHFPPTYLISEIDRTRDVLIQQLRQMVSDDSRLEIALNALDLSAAHMPPNILHAVQHKRSEIDAAIEERKRIAIYVYDKVSLCVNQLNSFPVSFGMDGGKSSIHQQRENFLISLQAIINSTELHEALRRIDLHVEMVRPISDAKRIKIQEINLEADRALERIKLCQRAESVLRQINFLIHLSVINEKIQCLEIAIESNASFQPALASVRRLYDSLNHIQNHFIYSVTPWNIRLRQFKTLCLQALYESDTSLRVDEDWQRTLSKIRESLFSIQEERVIARAIEQVGLFRHPIHHRIHHHHHGQPQWGSAI